MQRIIVFGNTGSGKSTLAEALAERLGLTFVELDALNWKPNWIEAETEEFREKVRDATRGGRWAVAGNYTSKTDDVTWPVAQVAVHLDLGLTRSVVRVWNRSWRRWRERELLWGTNTEHFAKHLQLWSRDSLLNWAVYAHFTRRSRLLGRRQDPRWAHIDFVRLRSPSEVNRWLEAVTRTPRPPRMPDVPRSVT
jgi:adenylate kinase family enzyme